ncbi:MAG: hypothetical protein AAF665_08140 [Pseudomonadota bacterium]
MAPTYTTVAAVITFGLTKVSEASELGKPKSSPTKRTGDGKHPPEIATFFNGKRMS